MENMTMEYIENNKYFDISWYVVSATTFAKEKENFKLAWYRKYMSVFRLQQYFNKMYDDPTYQFCRTRLDKMFGNLS
jgi:hypothetical protein